MAFIKTRSKCFSSLSYAESLETALTVFFTDDDAPSSQMRVLLTFDEEKDLPNYFYLCPEILKPQNTPCIKQGKLLIESALPNWLALAKEGRITAGYLKEEAEISLFSNLFQNQINFESSISLCCIPFQWVNKTFACFLVFDCDGRISPSAFKEHFSDFEDSQILMLRNLILQNEVQKIKMESEKFLLNILPKKIAQELNEKGFVEPVIHENVSIMFTDFVAFSQMAANSSPEELITMLDGCFFLFDDIAGKYNLERLKTIGDSYMCVAGMPETNPAHALDICLAALEIRNFISLMSSVSDDQKPFWNIRIGINSGKVIAGVIGKTKFSYDIWGDSVNIASRMESGAAPGSINISRQTYEQVKEYFQCTPLGVQEVKNQAHYEMFRLNRIKEEFAEDDQGIFANEVLKKLRDSFS